MHFSDAVSLSQSRRAAGFVPFAFAFAGGLALLSRSVAVLPLALVAGIVLEQRWPGDFAYGLGDGGPAAVTWFALRRRRPGARASGCVFADAADSERHGRARARGRALRAAGRGARLRGTGRRSHRSTAKALPPALLRELRSVPAARGRHRAAAGELQARRGCAGVRRRGAAPHVANTKREPARTAREGGRGAGSPPATPAIPRQVRCDLGRAQGPARTVFRDEGAARHAVLPARGRRRRAAAAEVRDAPAGARDRDARARARRPEVDPPRRGPADADARLGAPRALHRPARPQAGRGAARDGGPRALHAAAASSSAGACSSPTRTSPGT